MNIQPNSPFTRVDGKGLWRSWKRNFKNKLLALLDLIDNSLDAAIVDCNDQPTNGNNNGNGSGSDADSLGDFIGRVHIYPDEFQRVATPPTPPASSAQHAVPDIATSDVVDMEQLYNGAVPRQRRASPRRRGARTTANTGLCIINNCVKPVRPLEKVLEVYNSSKVHSGSGDIGENGVGLKQGCATLSDLSFVMVKNGEEGFVELGLIAESLQMLEGCYLPAFRFDISEVDEDDAISSLKNQMEDLFSQPQHANVKRCIEQYGSAMEGIDGSNVQKGLDRLCKHLESMLNFYDSQFVFAVVLDDMSYGNPDDKAVADPIQDLRDAIPRTYLHVPHSFDFRIGNSRGARDKVSFHYWPHRLVELSSFTVKINHSVPWHHEGPSKDFYKLRVFLGFDRMRINDNDQQKAASLCVYSRQSGRLIKNDSDARFTLGLTAGGTTYCQGLTVLIDDIEGKLPLNPTKQDVAFGEETHGEVHRENLFAWVGGITKFYYDYHLGRYGNKKTRLTTMVKNFGNQTVSHEMKEIDRCKLTTFQYKYKFYAKRSIRIDQKSATKQQGPDTHFILQGDPPPPPVVNTPSQLSGNKRRRVDDARDGATNDEFEPLPLSQGGNAFSQSQNSNQYVAAHAQQYQMQQQAYASQISTQLSQLPEQYRRNHANAPAVVSVNGQNQINAFRAQMSNHMNSQQLQQRSRDGLNRIQQIHQQIQQLQGSAMSGAGQATQPSSQNAGEGGASNGQVSKEVQRAASAGKSANQAPTNQGGPPAAKEIEVIDLLDDDDDDDENDAGPTAAKPVANGTEGPGPNVKAEVANNSPKAGTAPAAEAAANGDIDASAEAENDDNGDDGLDKEYYMGLCDQLTTKCKKRREEVHQARKENKHLKRENQELRKEVERLKKLCGEGS